METAIRQTNKQLTIVQQETENYYKLEPAACQLPAFYIELPCLFSLYILLNQHKSQKIFLL